MKKNYLIFVLVFCFLIFSLPVFGAVSYSRTPSGYTIQNPVNFLLSADTQEELFPENWELELPAYWTLTTAISEGEPKYKISNCLASTTLAVNKTINLPVGDYSEVYVYGWYDNECSVLQWTWLFLEEPEDDFVFEVVEAPAPAPTGYFPSDFATNTLAFVGGFITDLATPIYILVGLSLGAWIIRFIVLLF